MTAGAQKISLPYTSADLTPEWLTEALRSTGTISRATVSSFTKETIGEGVGILGELVLVDLTYNVDEPGAPKTVVAKFASAAEENRDIANMFGFYNNEIQFYKHLADKVPVRVPACYYVDIEEGTNRFVLLIEDLTEMRLGDQLDGCTVAEAGELVLALARTHAQTWGERGLSEQDWIPVINAPHYAAGVPALFDQSWPGMFEREPSLVPEPLRVFGTKYSPAIHSLQNRLSRGPRCLVHGDFRLDNIFFARDGGENVIIDWQLTGRARGPYDVGYLMSQSMAVADRRSSERDIVERYHQALVEGGVAGSTLEECWNDYRLATMYCVVYPIAGGAVDAGNERGETLIATMAERSFSAVLDLDALELLEN